MVFFQVHQQQAAVTPGPEEKICIRGVLVAGKLAIVKHVQVAAVPILGAIQDDKPRMSGGIIGGRAGNRLEYEFRPGVVIAIVIDGHLCAGLRRGRRQQKDTGASGERASLERMGDFHGGLFIEHEAILPRRRLMTNDKFSRNDK